ncbi:hypothetical protein [Neotabrizicola sp. sgz301269]|uniref:hypothetical protein n=1 Tax=Neotabrizicola sp. sgz301269 TaxID=3276282 RepID=UPI00376F62F3
MTQEAFQVLSDRLSRALETGNAALYRSLVVLPLRVAPRDAPGYVVETQDELDADFAHYRDTIVAAGITDITRELIEVVPEAKGNRLRYAVTLLRQDEPIGPPHVTELLLVQTATGLKIAEMVSTSTLVDWTRRAGPRGAAPHPH